MGLGNGSPRPVDRSALLGALPCAAEVVGIGENGMLVSTLDAGGAESDPVELNDLAAKMYFLALDPAMVAEMSSTPEAHSTHRRQLEN